MCEEKEPLHPLVRKVLTDVRLLMVGFGGLVVAIFLAGVNAWAQVQSTAKDAGVDAAAPAVQAVSTLRMEAERHEARSAEVHRLQALDIHELQEGQRRIERGVVELNANLRLLMREQGVKPRDLDGGP